MSLTIIFEKKNNEHTVYIRRIANLPKRLNIIILLCIIIILRNVIFRYGYATPTDQRNITVQVLK